MDEAPVPFVAIILIICQPSFRFYGVGAGQLHPPSQASFRLVSRGLKEAAQEALEARGRVLDNWRAVAAVAQPQPLVRVTDSQYRDYPALLTLSTIHR